MKVPLYPEIIYNNRQPLISVTYEYGEIELILPIAYEAEKPENISFLVFGQGDTLNPIISILVLYTYITTKLLGKFLVEFCRATSELSNFGFSD